MRRRRRRKRRVRRVGQLPRQAELMRRTGPRWERDPRTQVHAARPTRAQRKEEERRRAAEEG